MKTYCSKCFFYHVSLNKRGLKEPSAGASHCILCSEQITADSKSPVAGCCYTCWESQETIAAAIQVEGTDGRMAVESVTAECKVTSCEPHIVAQAFTTLEEMCVRNGIVAGGVLQASEASRLAVVDEKGFSARLGAEFSICFCCPK